MPEPFDRERAWPAAQRPVRAEPEPEEEDSGETERSAAADAAVPAEWPLRGEPVAVRAPDEEPQAEGPAEEPIAEAEPVTEPVAEPEPEPGPEPEPELEPVVEPAPMRGRPAREPASLEHAAGVFQVPDGFTVLEGEPFGRRRSVGVVVARFNRDITKALLEGALDALASAGVSKDAITVMPVPGAFELPLAAMALAKTRRYACIVALGCVIRGDTPHFDFVAGEAASGLQLSAIETGVPVAFGLLTCETRAQAEARIDRGAEAARTALEMADVFAQLRAIAASR
jgi:6,7-dimethyl-8-ribityllumazine synthase